MINACFAFLLLFQSAGADYYAQSATSFLSSSLPDQELSFKNTNRELLNATVFHLINQQRQQKKLDSLSFSEALFQVAKNFQEQLEFRSFNDPKKIDSKINLKLEEHTKTAGFKGGLVLAISDQNNALNYDGKSEFFYDKTDKSSEFRLYLGNSKQKKQGADLTLIPVYTYREFAQNLIKNLPSESINQLNNKAYQHIGIQLQWNYKTLEKNQIPQIKLLCIIGGFQTAGMRK